MKRWVGLGLLGVAGVLAALAGLGGASGAATWAAGPGAVPYPSATPGCTALHEDFEWGRLGAFVSPAPPYWSVAGQPGAYYAQSVVSFPAGGQNSTVIQSRAAFAVPANATQVTYSFGFGLYYAYMVGDWGSFTALYQLDGTGWQDLLANSDYGFHTYTLDVSNWAGHNVEVEFGAVFGSCCEDDSGQATLDDVTVRYTAPVCAPPPSATPTAVGPPTATATWHPGQFEDVGPAHPFYPYIECLAGRGIISGYQCGQPGEPCVPPGDRPYYRSSVSITRAQVAKIVSVAAGYNDPPTGPHFADVPASHPFYFYVEQLAMRGMVSGYTCGGANPPEPCQPPGNLPYFRPTAAITRGQMSKLLALAAGWGDPPPPGQQTFEDVPPGQPFYLYVEGLAGQGVISGYTCGGPGEGCVPPGNRPYFRPGAAITRGQTAKVGTLTFFPAQCAPPATATPTSDG